MQTILKEKGKFGNVDGTTTVFNIGLVLLILLTVPSFKIVSSKN